MSLIGKSLAHYEITAEIGKGGMGEVYQAKDQKLGRDVAIKVLPEEFARDADRVARFQREAKLLASLNHPNIAAIHGLEESDGTHFLVMELIEGDTLADRIKSSPIPIEETLKLAIQITEALEAAHDKGVIHRDLKPANVKVTPDGKVKVLDFGLAKAYAGDPENMNLSNSPTLSDAATQQGVILGTAAYMSPEQARGKPVDKRADIWAFGVVLFEMLTGKAAFLGKDVTDTLAAVIRSEPDWNNLPESLHWRLKELLERCLEKEARDRYGSISDARVDVRKVLDDPGGVFAQPSAAVKSKKKLRVSIPWVAAAAVLCIILTGLAVWQLKPIPKPQIIRSEFVLPEDQIFFRSVVGNAELAVSPDGSQFAYSTNKGIYIRSMNELEARLISGTDVDASALFFSPNGQWIGYFSIGDQKLKSISVSGGAPTDLCDAAMVFGATWHEDDTIVYADLNIGVCRIPAKGGTPELLVERPSVAIAQLLPDGKSVLYLDVSSQPWKTIGQSLETGEQKVVLESGWGAYLPTGHLTYGSDGNFFAVPFDLKNLEFSGGAVSLMEAPIGNSVSDSGTLVYVPGAISASGGRTLVWVDKEGNEEPISAAKPDMYFDPQISPDGTKVALMVNDAGSRDIWILDLDRGTMPKLTFDDAVDRWPLWTEDGQWIVFSSGRDEEPGIYMKAANGSGKVEKLASWPVSTAPFAWSKDGKTLLSWDYDPSSNQTGIAAMSMEGDNERKPLLEGEVNYDHPQISPDGRWLAYASAKSGQNEVYVCSYPDVESGDQWMVSIGGGYGPLWSPDGREIFYRNGESVMACAAETEPVFKPGKCEELFHGTYYFSRGGSQAILPVWDLHPDGKRFLMIKPPFVIDTGSSAEEPRKIVIVTNWLEELKNRVPVE